MKKYILFLFLSFFFCLSGLTLVYGDNAPITTAGNASACSAGGTVTVPITVTAFNGITSMQLRLDYDPGLMTYASYANVNTSLPGLMVNDVAVSATLHKVYIIWVDLTPVTLTDGTKLIDLNFTYVAGTGTLSFNNSANSGGDCEYAGINAIALNDIPTATYFHDATITFAGIGAPGVITGVSSVCAGATGVPYSVAPVSGATSYQWSYTGSGATIIGTSSAVTINYSVPTTGNLKVVASNTACGAGAPSPNLPVTVNSLPVPTITGSNVICSGNTAVYTTQAGMNAYMWSITGGGSIVAGGTGSDNTMTVTWWTPGPVTVCVNYTNPAGCTATVPTCMPVTVNALPVPTITGPSATPVGSSGNVYTTQPGMINYTWTVSAGGTITAGLGQNNITVTWNVAGGQQVCVNYTDPATQCTANPAGCYTVTVGNVPTPAGAISGPDTLCPNAGNVTYSIAAIANATGYIWTVPAGFTIISGANSNTMTVSIGPGAVSGNITVNGTNSYGNGASSTLPVTILSVPGTPGVINGPSAICDGTTGVGFSVPLIPYATNYLWTIPAGASIVAGSNTNMITVNFGPGAVSGNITVVGNNTCGNGPPSASHSITVNPIPETPVASTPGYWSATSSAPIGNQWYWHEVGILAGDTAQTITVPSAGHFYTRVTLNGCPSDTSNHVFVLVEGINNHTKTDVDIFPVPNLGAFKIVMNGSSSEIYFISIIDAKGDVVYRENNVVFTGNSEKTFDLRPIPAGFYSVVLQGKDSEVIRKIVIRK